MEELVKPRITGISPKWDVEIYKFYSFRGVAKSE